MNKTIVITAILLSCTGAQGATYSFAPSWDDAGNNDLIKPGTRAPYSEAAIRSFLDQQADRKAIEEGRKALGACGVIEVKKGCHQANDRHVTIHVDGRESKNKVKACEPYQNGTYHIQNC